MIRDLSKIHSAFLQRMFTEPHLCTMHCTRHCREPTGQKCIPSRELHSRRKISVKKNIWQDTCAKYRGGKSIREGGYRGVTQVGSRGRGTILNGATRECFTEKATGVLSPGGGESAGTSLHGYTGQECHRVREQHMWSVEWESSCCSFCGRGRKGPMWMEPRGAVWRDQNGHMLAFSSQEREASGSLWILRRQALTTATTCEVPPLGNVAQQG